MPGYKEAQGGCEKRLWWEDSLTVVRICVSLEVALLATERKWVVAPRCLSQHASLVLGWVLRSVSQRVSLFCPAAAKSTVGVGELACAEQDGDPGNAAPPPCGS